MHKRDTNMKALVLAAALSATEPQPVRAKAKVEPDKRPGAERNRFTEADLEEMFGDMAPTSDEPEPVIEIPEMDFIRWDPASAPEAEEAPERPRFQDRVINAPSDPSLAA